jgi:hypothetical protein
VSEEEKGSQESAAVYSEQETIRLMGLAERIRQRAKKEQEQNVRN